MADAVKAALTAAFVTFIVVTTGRVDIALTAFGLSGPAAAAAVTFATVLVSAGIGMLTSKGLDANAQNFGSKFASRVAAAPRQIVYGQCRVGGNIVYMQTGGTDNHMLHMIIALAGHEIEEVVSVRFNDIDLTSTTETVAGETVHTVTNADFTNTDNENAFASGRLVRFQPNLGADDQTVSNFAKTSVASFGGGITDNHRFRGIAYLYVQIVFDAEAFGGGVPAISCIVKGKKCFDPRDTSTAFTSNPALIIRDFLTDTRYGLKALSNEINDSTSAGGFAAAANICDQTVTVADGSTTEKRYAADGFSNMAASGEGILEGLLSAMAGKITYTNGKFNIFAGAAQTADMTITDDDLLEPVVISTKPKSGEVYNTVKAAYVNAEEDYIANDAPILQNSTFLNEDTPSGGSTTNFVKTLEIQLPFTTSTTMAQRIQRVALNANRQTMALSCLVNMNFFQLQPSDYVNLTNTRLGFSSKTFEVLSTNLEIVGDDNPFLAVRLNLKETASSIYDFATGNYLTPQSEGGAVTTSDKSISAPTNLTATNVINNSFTINQVAVRLSWTNSGFQQHLIGIQIHYKKSSDSNYDEYALIPPSTTQATIRSLEANTAYDFRIRYEGFTGVFSSYATVNNHNTGSTIRSSGDVITSEGTAANITNQGNLATLDTVDTAQLVDDAVTTAKIINDAVTNALIATDAVNQDSIAANSVTASEINVSTLSAISANVGTVNAGTIDAGSMTINNLNAGSITAGTLNANRINLNGSTLSVTSDGLNLNVFDVFTHANSGTLGNIEGTGGNDVSMTDTANLVSSIFVNASPHHIAKSASSSASPTVASGNVMGGTSNNSNGSPLFQYNFTTPNYSGTRKYLVIVTFNPIGSYDSDSASMFAFCMRATTSSTAFTSTSASDYVTTRGTSIGGSNAGAIYIFTDVVTLAANTEHYIWVFGQLEDVGDGGHPSIDHGILDGSIQVAGLSK